MRLTDFRALTFDCYGTLIDWERGITTGVASLVNRVDQPLTRDDVLEAHARHESSQQRYTPEMPYRDLLAVVFKRLAEEWKVPYSTDEAVAYGCSVAQWPAFPDSASTLQYLKKYFTPNGDNEWRISRDLVDSVEFSRVNLSEPTDTRRFRDIDVIFCRNLLIYFDDLSRRVAAEAMFDSMSPGGFICLGHSESMSRMSSLYTVRRFPDAMVYQKPLEA